MVSLADDLDRIVDEKLAAMKKAGIEWCPKRQAEYNAACVAFSRASKDRDQAGMDAALAIVNGLEAEGGIL